METPKEPTPVPASTALKRRKRKKRILLILLILLLMAAAAGGTYYWCDKQAKDESKKKDAEVSALNDKVTALEKEVAAEKANNEASKKSTKKKPTASALENIQAAVSSGNLAALEGYMASSVRVIIAASEGMGDRTRSEAVSDLQPVVDNAAGPWDFDLPAATLNSYRASFYASYFPADALIGKSADNNVLSFTFDDAGKISGIFIGSHDSMLL